MKLLAGLGNPGKEYALTRHNSGFMVIDCLAAKLKLNFNEEKFQASYTLYHLGAETFILAKPLTYMNNSGEAIAALKNYYKLKLEDIIIVHDDLDLPLGKLRLREKGSGGGHKGMGSIISLLGSEEIKRLRIGIGRDEKIAVKDYVLGKLTIEEEVLFKESVTKAANALEFALTHPFTEVMNRFNG